jgi:hypothetical protein
MPALGHSEVSVLLDKVFVLIKPALHVMVSDNSRST